ncbi:hypothetical protein DFP73DRAFT_616287 [Morchella snyderi]|nr:hypothetical protein DFP73DRAFT_616287 [Morchella snyderi]
MEHSDIAITGPPAGIAHGTEDYSFGGATSTLINARFSLQTLIFSDLNGVDSFSFQESHLLSMRALWAETLPTSRYHYRVRRRVEQWFITIAQVRDFTIKLNITCPRLEEAQYREILRLRIAVHSDQDKGQVIKDRMMIIMGYGGADAVVPVGGAGPDPPVESIDFVSIRAAHILLVAAWNNLGRELLMVRRVEGLDHIFGSNSLTEEEKHLSVAILTYWLAEVDLEYGELYPDQRYDYAELLEGC